MKNYIAKFLCSLFLLVSMAAVDAALPQYADGEALPSLAPMLENVTPAVVNIATEGIVEQNRNPLLSDPFFRRFFPNFPNQQLGRKVSSLGSGVIVDAKRGLVLTNHHVIANAVQITISLHDGKQLEAELVGADPATDVAVLKIPTEGLSALKPMDSDNLRVGDYVVAIGNPFGLSQTVTSGIVSGLRRSGLGIEAYEDFIQTDASINPGNSGGALVNLRGELVGINTAIVSPQRGGGGGNIGIGLAIPINLALQIMEQIVNTGEVRRGFLGVNMQDINPELAEAFKLDQQSGAIINQVFRDSPADRAGLRAGDIVVATDDKKIKNAADLRNRIGLLPIGEKITFKILRDGKIKTVRVIVDEHIKTKTGPKVVNILLEGIAINDIKKDSPYFGQVQGILVLEVRRGSLAWHRGLRGGDIITSVNKTPIQNIQDFLAVVDKKEDSLLLNIIRGNTAQFLVLKK